jgi:hypothetical protein
MKHAKHKNVQKIQRFADLKIVMNLPQNRDTFLLQLLFHLNRKKEFTFEQFFPPTKNYFQ